MRINHSTNTEMLTLGLLFTVLPACHCFGCSCGSLRPLNPYFFVNETLRMNCTLDESTLASGVTANDLDIVFGNDVVEGNTVVVSNRTLTLEKRLTTTDEEAMYLCIIRGRPYGLGIVDSQYLKVDIGPQNISNFGCVVHDWDYWMNCSWTLPKYKHLQLLDIRLLASNDGGASFHDCPYMGGNKTFCVWNHLLSPRDFYPVDVPIWYFSFTIWNVQRNVSVTSTFTMRPEQNVKPAPIENVSITKTTSSCISVKWAIRKYRSQVVRVTLTSKHAEPKVKETGVNDKRVTLCGLSPSTEYTVRVIRKPPDTGYWSDPTEIAAKTRQVSDSRDDEQLIVIFSVVAAVVVIVVIVVISVVCCHRKMTKKKSCSLEAEKHEMRKIRIQKTGVAEIPEDL